MQTPASGRGEVRIALFQYTLWDFEFDIAYFKGDPTVPNSPYVQLVGFYGAVKGMADDWLFLDPFDNTVTGATFGFGDGNTKQFPIIRTIGSAGPVDLIQNFVSPPQIYVGGVLQSGTYSIDSYGTCTFASAPAMSAILQWTGSFYFRCRFSEDSLSDLQFDLYQISSIKSLKFQSILL